MKTAPLATCATLVLATYCLAACSAAGAGSALQVTSISAAQGLEVAGQFCSDLAAMTIPEAHKRMASRTYKLGISGEDVSAIVDYAQWTECPEQFR